MRKLRALIFILAIVVALVFAVNKLVGSFGAPVMAALGEIVPQPAEQQQTTIKISAIGDCAFGRDYRSSYPNSLDDVFARNNKDYSYFFAKVAGIFKADDLTIANLETSLTTKKDRAEKYDYGNNFWFKGDPKYAKALKAGGIELAGLANNHTYDYKKAGYLDTRTALKTAGVAYYGYEDLYEKEIKGIRVGIAGFNQLGNVEQGTDLSKFKAEVKSKIQLLKSRNDLVLVSFHWGKEYVHEFTPMQRTMGRFAIDTGADLVIGHHPHVLQGVEKYKDKYIIYSLGNFSFGGNKMPPDFDTFIYQQQFVFDADKKLVQIVKPSYIPCYISTSKTKNNFQPMPVKGYEAERILDKINEYSPYKARTSSSTKPYLVDLKSYIPNLIIEQRYASTNNITGEVLYRNVPAELRQITADKLKKASDALFKKGYRIKVWDAYRPASVQKMLWDKAVNKLYFMDPKKGSNHTRGCAVDITLTDLDGNQLSMPSDFDDMTGKAKRTFKFATQEQKSNALMLTKVMQSAGFQTISTEWWHYDDTEFEKYDFIKE